MSNPQEQFQAPPAPAPKTELQGERPTKLRPFAIGFFVVGLLVAVIAIARVIPMGMLTTGGALIFFGVLLFGLSFIRLPVIPDAEPPLSFLSKVAGIFYEPSRVFRNLRAHPHWVGAFIIVAALNAVYAAAFVQRATPERIVDHTVEKLAQTPFAPPPEAMEKMRTDQLTALKNPAERVGNVVKSFVGNFALGAVLTALCLLGILAFGGRINFWQALAVSFYSWLPIAAIHKVLSLVLLFVKAPEDLHPVLGQETLVQDNLGILFAPADHPVLFALTSFIGLTSFYGLWLRAKGLQFGGTRVGSSAAWGVAIVIWVLILVLATAVTALFAPFIS